MKEIIIEITIAFLLISIFTIGVFFFLSSDNFNTTLCRKGHYEDGGITMRIQVFVCDEK